MTVFLGDYVEKRSTSWRPCGPNLPYVALEHIEPTKLRLTGIGNSVDTTSNKTIFEASDVLYGKLRPYFEKCVQPDFSGVCSSEIWALYSKDTNKLLQSYLRWIVSDPYFSEYANSAETGTHMPRAQWSWVSKLELVLPSIEEQLQISTILQTITDRIESIVKIQLLTQNAADTLYEIAVDESREVMKLEDLAEVIMGNSPPGSSYNEEGEGSILFQGATEFGFRFPVAKVYTTSPSRIAVPGDTLVSVRAPVGTLNVALEECCIGRGVAAIRSNSYPSVVNCALRVNDQIWDAFNSEGTVFGSINGPSLKSLPIVVPKEKDELESRISVLFETSRQLEIELRVLEALRRFLLPRLIARDLVANSINKGTK